MKKSIFFSLFSLFLFFVVSCGTENISLPEQEAEDNVVSDGDDSNGDNSDGDNSDGDDSNGDNSDGDNSDGDNSDGDDSDGDNSDGDNSDGDDIGNVATVEKPIKFVLVEDFSGQSCPNCPAAHTLIDNIVKNNNIGGQRVIPVVIYAGGLVGSDFKTTEGQQLWNHFGISYQPRGLIDRKSSGSNKFEFLSGRWQSEIVNELALESPLHLNLSLTLEDNSLTIKPTLAFYQDLNQQLKFTLYIIEDGIFARQSGVATTLYNHRYVFRDAITSHLGDDLEQTSFKKNDYYSLSAINYELSSVYNKNKLYLIGFVSNKDTEYVLQATRLKIQ